MNGAPGEPDHGDSARLELGSHEPDRVEGPAIVSSAGGAASRSTSRAVEIGLRDPRPVALDEVELEPHADERREDVGEDDRGVDAERVDRHQRHLGCELRRADQLEHRVPLP